MRALAIINREKFVDRGWVSYSNYNFCKNQTVLPLVAAEVIKAAAAMPLAFVKDQISGKFQLFGLCSLDDGLNLFVAPSGQWLGGYIPAVLRGFPFALVRANDADNLTLAIDEASGLIVNRSEPEAQPFFDSEGRPATEIQKILDFLAQVDQSHEATNRAIRLLDEANAISPWSIAVKTPDGSRQVNGLFRADLDVIRSLDGQFFLNLRDSDALTLAYCQAISMEHITIFDNLRKIHDQIEKNDIMYKETIDKSFPSHKEEEVKFDWSSL